MYYETDRIASLIFLLLIFAISYIAISRDKKNTEKRGENYLTRSYKNRGAYSPNRK